MAAGRILVSSVDNKPEAEEERVNRRLASGGGSGLRGTIWASFKVISGSVATI